MFARKCLAVLRKRDGYTAILHIECAAIAGRGRRHISMTIDDKISENLVAAIGNLSAIRLPAALPPAGKCLIDEALGLRVLTGKEQPADFREGFVRIRTVILKRRARPQGELINDDAFGPGDTKDHRADTAISKWRAL